MAATTASQASPPTTPAPAAPALAVARRRGLYARTRTRRGPPPLRPQRSKHSCCRLPLHVCCALSACLCSASSSKPASRPLRPATPEWREDAACPWELRDAVNLNFFSDQHDKDHDHCDQGM